MARYELTKSIEARKLNPRSGLPLGEPAVTVPYSAILEKVEESWDLVKFSYLGLRYQCPTPTFKEAARLYGADADQATSAAADGGADGMEVGAEPMAASAKEAMMQWEELSSSQQKVLRAKVPGGWLVAMRGSGLCFLPDPSHEWSGRTLE
jgi:hypothetical protein